MDIKLSVVMAVYNSEKYLRKAIDSLINQTLREIEIIAVDDGSADGSWDILSGYAASEDRIHICRNNEESDGAALARNLGVSKAIGEYVIVLDADDFFESNMLEEAYNMAKEKQADVVLFDGYRYDDMNDTDLERGSILYLDKIPKMTFEPMENAEHLFEMTSGAAWNALFSMELVRKYDLKFKSFHHADDFEFVYTGFALADKIAVLPKRLIHYRVNIATSQAANINEWPDTAWQAMNSFLQRLKELGLYDDYRLAYIRKALDYQIFYLNHMKTARSFHHLYVQLKESRLEELELSSASPQDIGSRELTKIRDLILAVSPDEYLFRKMNNLEPFDTIVQWKRVISGNSKVILFGGDRTAVDICHSILWNRDYELVAWVDPQYDVLGYPVEPPDIIKKTDYDYILVAVRTRQEYNMVCDSLRELGVDEDRIVGLI